MNDILATSNTQPQVGSYALDNIMAASDRSPRFNLESVKVNRGIPDVTSAFACNKPPTAIDFSQLANPTPNLSKHELSTASLVICLLCSPPHAFIHGVLSINWVLGFASAAFAWRQSDGRWVLREDSELRRKGRALGLPASYYEWLCGDEEDVGSSEVGLLLTEKFFESEIGDNFRS